ncbi:VWA domain-containing protein [Priestia megaterium]
MGNVVNLAKKAKVVLEKKEIFGEKAHVVLATDISVSMSHLYHNGVVQELVDRLLGIGINMDADRCIDVFAFGERDHEIGTATEKNHEGFVNNVMLKKVSLEYSTRYAGAMNRIVNKFGNPIKPAKQGFFAKFLGKKQPEKKTDIPTLVFFVTDGDNFDKAEAERIINESSNQAIFWQFVGIGRERFVFLQKLDDLQGRYLDNADFFSVNDLNRVSDDDLYNKLLNEFPEWIKEARAKGVLS